MNLPLSLLDNDKQGCNKDDTPISLGEILSSENFAEQESLLTIAIGKDKNGGIVLGDLITLPHLLIAGASGTGKSTYIHTIIISILYKAAPRDAKLLIIDPKIVELSRYNYIPHLLIPVVTDTQKAEGALQAAVKEIKSRLKTFSLYSVRDIIGYNALAKEPLPRVVVIIYGISGIFAEDEILYILQTGRSAGIHLIASVSSFKTLSSKIRSSFGSKMTFAVGTSSESKAILGYAGAEKLSGVGEAIYAPLGERPILVKSCFTDTEIDQVINYVKENNAYEHERALENPSMLLLPDSIDAYIDEDEMLPFVIEHIIVAGQVSISSLQRHLRLGYARTARIIGQLEERGIVSSFDGSKSRQVLLSKEDWLKMKLSKHY